MPVLYLLPSLSGTIHLSSYQLFKWLLLGLLISIGLPLQAQSYDPDLPLEGNWRETWDNPRTVCPGNSNYYFDPYDEDLRLRHSGNNIRITYLTSGNLLIFPRIRDGVYMHFEEGRRGEVTYFLDVRSPVEVQMTAIFDAYNIDCTLTTTATWSYTDPIPRGIPAGGSSNSASDSPRYGNWRETWDTTSRQTCPGSSQYSLRTFNEDLALERVSSSRVRIRYEQTGSRTFNSIDSDSYLYIEEGRTGTITFFLSVVSDTQFDITAVYNAYDISCTLISHGTWTYAGGSSSRSTGSSSSSTQSNAVPLEGIWRETWDYTGRMECSGSSYWIDTYDENIELTRTSSSSIRGTYALSNNDVIYIRFNGIYRFEAEEYYWDNTYELVPESNRRMRLTATFEARYADCTLTNTGYWTYTGN